MTRQYGHAVIGFLACEHHLIACRLDVGDGEDAARRLWGEAGVRVIPGTYLSRADENGFNPGKPYIRVALVHDLQTTETALARLIDLFKT